MRVLIIEAEEKVAHFIQKGLEQSSYAVDIATSAEEGVELARTNPYHAIILDMMLPGTDSLHAIGEMRAQGVLTPVMALSTRDSSKDRVASLDSGCDDYLTRPFAFEELLARLRALLRRTAGQRTSYLEYAGLAMDTVTRSVTRSGTRIELTNKEYALLELLLRHPGQVFTRTVIMEGVWGYDFDNGSNVLEVYITFLRRKIDQGFSRKLLHTVRGVGYVLRDESG